MLIKLQRMLMGTLYMKRLLHHCEKPHRQYFHYLPMTKRNNTVIANE